MFTTEYEDDYEELARLQQIDLEEQDSVDDQTELEEDNLRQGTDREGRRKKKGGKKKGDKKKKGGSGKNRKSVKLPNRHGAEIRTWGQVMLFNVRADPEVYYENKYGSVQELCSTFSHIFFGLL